MTILHPPTVSTETLSRDGSLFVGEASTLGLPVGGGFGRVYDDACDVGLTFRDERSLLGLGARLVVYAIEDEKTREGDVLYWDLGPADLRDRRSGAPTVRIFND